MAREPAARGEIMICAPFSLSWSETAVLYRYLEVALPGFPTPVCSLARLK